MVLHIWKADAAIMSLGIPYMGSKRKLAGYILQAITSRHPGITDFYDLFGGGGSVSFTAIKNYRFNVHYNELNKSIFSLVKYLKENKTFDPKFYEWVTREEFFKQINRNGDGDWYSGFVMSCWSFGNKQSSYIYGADIENIKHLAHKFVVDGCLDSMREIGVDIPELLNTKNIQKRRMLFCNHIKNSLSVLKGAQNLELVEHLARLQNLQNLQSLPNLQNLHTTNLSYELVEIKGDDPVIYCDIPYKGTEEYKEGGFDHDGFYNWFSNLDYPAYLSEYDAPFEKIEMVKHRSSLSATNNKKKTMESIFYNGKGKVTNYKLF